MNSIGPWEPAWGRGLAWDVWLKAGGLGLREGSEGQRLDQVALLGVSIAVEHTKLLVHPQLYPKN